MTSDEFWALIDATRPAEPDPDVHADAITRALVDRGAADAVAFAREFDAAYDALYRWDVWGVIYLLRGGCSDDSFDYARAWVMGEGKATWERVIADPEAWAVALVDDVVASDVDLDESLGERGFDDGESLLYAADIAHEQVTGAELPVDPARQARGADGPAGEEWDEDEVEAAFPRLAAALADALAAAERNGSVDSERALHSETFDIEGGGRLTLEEFAPGAGPAAPGGAGPPDGDTVMSGVTSAADLQIILAAVQGAEAQWTQRNHAGVVDALVPVLDHPVRRTQMSGILPPDLVRELLYRGGISRLQCGDPDGAADWLGMAVTMGVDDGRTRRALAQVEVSRGELDRAEALLDTGPDAVPMEFAIATAVAGYRRDRAEVLRRSAAMFAATDRSEADLHPLDVASMYVAAGLALVEVGEWTQVLALAEVVRSLVEGAPPGVPLAEQCGIMVAGAHRLAGDLEAAEVELRTAWPHLQPDTCDLGLAEREAARLRRAGGHAGEIADLYARAAATFRAAGEQFLAADTEREAAAV